MQKKKKQSRKLNSCSSRTPDQIFFFFSNKKNKMGHTQIIHFFWLATHMTEIQETNKNQQKKCNFFSNSHIIG